MITAVQHLKTPHLEIVRVGFRDPEQDWFRVYEHGKPARTVNDAEALRLANEAVAPRKVVA